MTMSQLSQAAAASVPPGLIAATYERAASILTSNFDFSEGRRVP
ncbi:hypothetical protein P3T23_006097 [Paraburkholderia sp. GAS448]